MGMQNSGWQSAGAGQVEDLSDIWTFGGGAPISRASLLATASPSAAQAQFGGMNQIISGPRVGPIKSNGGAITVTSTGIISGGPDGVDAVTQSRNPRDDRRRKWRNGFPNGCLWGRRRRWDREFRNNREADQQRSHPRRKRRQRQRL
jgi:hypothetical protein